jgi:uncharacterized damage-inducible protein DinB
MVNDNYNFSVMSQLQQLLLGHIGYSGWATGQILNACSPLDSDQLDLDCGASHTSILRTLRHIHDGERVWLRRLEEVDNDRLPPGPAPERSFEYLVESWPVLREGYRHWLEAASDLDLTEEILTILPDGAEFRVPRLQIILHVINHTSYHRGQIVTMLRALGVQPPNTDLTCYYATMPKVAER